jgi:ATP-dependent Lon protease
MPPRNWFGKQSKNPRNKDSGDVREATPGSKKPKQDKKRGAGAPPSDDESVDSRGNIRGLIDYSMDDEEVSAETDSSEPTPKKKTRQPRKAATKARGRIQKTLAKENTPSSKSKSSSFEEESVHKKDDMDDDEDDDDYDEDDDDYDEDEENTKGPAEISISFTGLDGGGQQNKMVPVRHNMKTATENVRNFVKLVTEPLDSGGIDEQIDYFKTLPEDKQKEILKALERPAVQEESIMFKILGMNIPSATKSVILAKYHMVQNMDPSVGEYYKHRAWLEKATALPLGNYKDLPVKLEDGSGPCSAFMERARKCMTTAIYGQEESKLQILQFIASKIANPTSNGMNLLLVGPPGIGKTSLIKNGIANALQYPFQFISLSGDSDASTYSGHQLVYEGSHAGKIVNSLIAAKSMSMVMMFDELDKISATPKGEEVQNLLVHMTDSVQNCEFEDKYLAGIPLDLSRVMFAFSANDINKIDKVLLDRMVVIHLKGYEKKEKVEIAEKYIIPAALGNVHLDEKVAISREVIEYIISEYANGEAGVRELKRCIEQIAQKVNMLRIFNTKELPFHIADFALPFVLKKAHVELFLKKKPADMDESARRMYT